MPYTKIDFIAIFILSLPLNILLIFRFLFFKERFSPFKNFGDSISFLYYSSLFFGIFLFALYPENAAYYPSMSAMMFLGICLIVYFSPLYYFQRRRALILNVVSKKIFKFCCFFILIGGWVAIIHFTPRAIDVLTSNVSEFRILLNTGELDVGSKTMTDKILVGFSTFYGIAQLLGLIVFASDLYGKWSKLIGVLLLISSVSYVINAFSFGGRDGVVYWIVSLWVNILLVRFFMGGLRIKILKPYFILSVLLLLIPFSLITASRFSNIFGYSLFDYMAQQTIEFNNVFILDPPLYHGDFHFYQFKEMLFGKERLLTKESMYGFYFEHGVFPWRFKYFFGSFLMDFGKIGTLTIVLLMALTVFILLIKKTRFSINDHIVGLDALLLLYLYCQIGFMGVFYFKHMALNNYMLALIGLSAIVYLGKLCGLKSFVSLKPATF